MPNGVAAPIYRGQPRFTRRNFSVGGTTMPNLLIKFIIRTNFLLQTTLHKQANTVELIQKLHKCPMRKSCRLEPLVSHSTLIL